MEYIYAALLLHKAGKKVDEKSMNDVLSAAGVKVNEARVKALVAALEGVDIEEALATAVPSPGAAAQTVEEKKEEKKPAEEEKKSEEEAAAGLSSLFG